MQIARPDPTATESEAQVRAAGGGAELGFVSLTWV